MNASLSQLLIAAAHYSILSRHEAIWTMMIDDIFNCQPCASQHQSKLKTLIRFWLRKYGRENLGHGIHFIITNMELLNGPPSRPMRYENMQIVLNYIYIHKLCSDPKIRGEKIWWVRIHVVTGVDACRISTGEVANATAKKSEQIKFPFRQCMRQV